LIQLLLAPKGIQCKIAKYSHIGRTLENATLFSDWGSDGSIMPHLLNNVRLAKAKTTMAEAASTQKMAAPPKLETPQPFPLHNISLVAYPTGENHQNMHPIANN
jgi:hypothetical protein